MPIPPSSLLPGRIYYRSQRTPSSASALPSTLPSPPSSSRLYRRILLTGPRHAVTSPSCLRPFKNDGGVWVRYETWIRGKRLERTCTRHAFLRWAEGRVRTLPASVSAAAAPRAS